MTKLDKAHPDASRRVPEESQNITIEKIKALLPSKTSIAVTQEIVDLINNAERDTGLPQELIEEDVLSYLHLFENLNRVGLKDLVNAIKYCNLKRNYDNKDAWAIVFPEKYQRLVDNNMAVDNHVSMYNSTKIVTAVDKEMMIAVSLQYAPYFHAATKELYKIGVLGKGGKDTRGNEMTVTPMVRVQALKELTTITKPPEEQKINISVNPGAEALSVQAEMNEQLKAIVAQQKRRLNNGEDIIDVQQLGISFDSVGGSSNE